MKHKLRKKSAWFLFGLQFLLALTRWFSAAAKVYTYRQQLLLGDVCSRPRNMRGINV